MFTYIGEYTINKEVDNFCSAEVDSGYNLPILII